MRQTDAVLTKQSKPQPSGHYCELSLLGFVMVTFDMTVCLLDVNGKRAVPVTFPVCHLYVHTHSHTINNS